MGSIPLSLYTSGSLLSVDYSLSLWYSSSPLENEYLTDLVLYSAPLSFFSPLNHYFLLCKTASGQQFKLEYSANQGMSITNHYIPGIREQIYRKGKVIPSTTTTAALKVFEKYAKEGKYHVLEHNCWNVAVDAFEELSGDTPVNLGFDFIQAIEANNQFKDPSEQEENIKCLYYKKGLVFDTIRALLESGHSKSSLQSLLASSPFPSLLSPHSLLSTVSDLKWETPLFWLLTNKSKEQEFTKNSLTITDPRLKPHLFK